MKFQIISDIHLEMLRRVPRFPVLAENLILAGDIGYIGSPSHRQFIKDCVENYKRVIYVAGNHEFYGGDYDRRLEKLATYSDIVFLEKGIIDIDENIRILGTTLWSHIPDEAIFDTESIMNDYHCINYKHRKLTGKDTNYLHRISKRWLDAEIAKGREENKHLIVVTHHLPSFQMIAPKYKYENNYGFASDCEDLMHNGPVRAWICGHSHTQMERRIGDTICVMASVGYPSEVRENIPHMCTMDISSDGVVTVEWHNNESLVRK